MATSKWTKERISAAKTFELQDELPSLPLPDLDQTIARYLRSVQPFLSSDEYQHTKSVVQEYAQSSDAQKAQAALRDRAANSKNWLEEWWDSLAYLQYRETLYPLLNFGGCSPHFTHLPPKMGTQVERGALMGWLAAKYWHQLYKQTVPVMQTNAPVPLCMYQFSTLFCTSRFPKESQDELHRYFHTEEEEKSSKNRCATHAIIQHDGCYFKLDLFDRSSGQLISYAEFRHALEQIVSKSFPSPPVGALTCLKRDDWARMRAHFSGLSQRNRVNLEAVDSCVFMLSLTDDAPPDEARLNHLAVAGPARYQWADKSMLWHIHKNGLVSSSCDHTPNEAIVMIALTGFIDGQIVKMNYKIPSGDIPAQENPVFNPVRLEFDVDDQIQEGIRSASALVENYSANLSIQILHYRGFARDLCRKHGYNVDTVVQMVAQLAYFRLHSKPAPTYETASTKQFYHGRSETMKSCTVEAVDFVRAMCSQGSMADRLAKFRKAVAVHDVTMKECQGGQGVDRHLLGLRVQSRMLGLPDPPIFRDPAYIRSGGDGNYVLSTSFLGATNTYGGVTPMVKDGYGVFYKATKDVITIFLSCWKDSAETNKDKMRDSLIWALDQIKPLIELEPSKL